MSMNQTLSSAGSLLACALRGEQQGTRRRRWRRSDEIVAKVARFVPFCRLAGARVRWRANDTPLPDLVPHLQPRTGMLDTDEITSLPAAALVLLKTEPR